MRDLANFSVRDYLELLTELSRELDDESLGKSVPEERPKLCAICCPSSVSYLCWTTWRHYEKTSAQATLEEYLEGGSGV